MREESNKLSHIIEAVMASLKVHYDNPETTSYNITDATNSLATFMNQAKETEQAELNNRFQVIMVSSHAALW